MSLMISCSVCGIIGTWQKNVTLKRDRNWYLVVWMLRYNGLHVTLKRDIDGAAPGLKRYLGGKANLFRSASAGAITYYSAGEALHADAAGYAPKREEGLARAAVWGNQKGAGGAQSTEKMMFGARR
jgi:hypothetical protein